MNHCNKPYGDDDGETIEMSKEDIVAMVCKDQMDTTSPEPTDDDHLLNLAKSYAAVPPESAGAVSAMAQEVVRLSDDLKAAQAVIVDAGQQVEALKNENKQLRQAVKRGFMSLAAFLDCDMTGHQANDPSWHEKRYQPESALEIMRQFMKGKQS